MYIVYNLVLRVIRKVKVAITMTVFVKGLVRWMYVR